MLTSNRHDEAISTIYSSLTVSFIGSLPLSIFTRTIDASFIQSLQLIHLVWPSWWKMHVFSRSIGHSRTHCEFWTPPEPEASLAKAEWNELWRLFSQIGSVKRLHVTIFQVRSVPDGTTVFSAEELLPALQNIRANEFLVEAWAEMERIEEPSAERPFRLHYTPALGGQRS
jgi:hypothetical protein